MLVMSQKHKIEPVSSKRYKLACAPIENSVQPAHRYSMVRVFDGQSLGSQGSSVSLGGKLKHTSRMCGRAD